MKTIRQISRYGRLILVALVAAAGMGATGQWSAGSKPKSAIESRVVGVFSTFEEDWALIDAFITNHAIVPNPSVKTQIHDETYNRVHNWQCVGTGLGYPQPMFSGLIYFDTSENAESCAEMIIDLANR